MISNPPSEGNLTSDTTNDATDFNIKVENNTQDSPDIENITSNETNLNTVRNNLQNITSTTGTIEYITETESDLQHLTYLNNDHIAQFHIQTALSIDDLQNLQKISNRNVLMSQAALPEENKEGEVNIKANMNLNRSFSNDLDNQNSDSTTEVNDSKQYLSETNFSTEEHAPLFIKHEGDHVITQVGEEVVEAAVKTENVSQTYTSTRLEEYRPIIYLRIDDEDNAHIVPKVIIETKKENIENPRKRKRGNKGKPIKPPNLLPNENIAPKKTIKSEKIARKETFTPIAPKLPILPLHPGNHPNKILLKPYSYSMSHTMDGGDYFEVLGRCNHCFRFSRTISYCRAEKNHRDPRASVCLECEAAGLSTVVCRRKLYHSAPNALPLNIVINTRHQHPDHIKELCQKHNLPSCFGELHSIVLHHADITFVGNKAKNENGLSADNLINAVPPQRKPTDYARGYLHPYTKERWNSWFAKFKSQTSANFHIRTGKRVNKKTDHGVANHNGKIVPYRTLETQLYNCALGGKPRKRKIKEGVKKRKERGSKLIGCTAVLHTRLLETENKWLALEVTVPKITAHLSCHDPRVTPNPINGNNEPLLDLNEYLMTQINSTQFENNVQGTDVIIQKQIKEQHKTVDSRKQQKQQRQQTEQIVNQSDTTMKQSTLLELRKNTKNLFFSCAAMLDMIDSQELLTSLHDEAQETLTKIVKETANKFVISKSKKSRKSNSVSSDNVENIHNIEDLEKLVNIG